MSIRDTLNENRTIVMAVAILVLVVAGGLAVQQIVRLFNPIVDTGVETKYYFSDDDGATMFVDSADKIPPFDHNGKEAVRAHVYMCGGKQVVLFLERFTQERKRVEEEARAQRASGAVVPLNIIDPLASEEIKKPGQPWITKRADSAPFIMAPKCDSGEYSEEVFPK